MTPAALLNALLFAAAGVILFALAFWTVSNLLPGRLWSRALDDQHLGASILLAAVALALGTIIAAAVH